MSGRAVVVFSGGPDSTAAALWGVAQGYDIELLSFDFKASKQYGEMAAAVRVATTLGLKHTIIDFRSPMASFGSKVHIMMHAGAHPGLIDQTTDHRLPFGGGMVLATAACYASYNDVHTVVWGATADDAVGDPYEYTAEFGDDLAKIVGKSLGQKFDIFTPFASMSKVEVSASFAAEPDIFARTWSCKTGTTSQCGTCQACVARRVSAEFAGFADLTTYDSISFEHPFTDEERLNFAHIELADRGRVFGSERPGPGPINPR